MNREILLGIGGGIASYKSADLLRRLRDQGFGVSVVPTSNSLNFVGIATWEALSGRPVSDNLWNNVHQVPHIALAKNLSAMIVAPATANIIAKIAAGIGDDFLTTLVLANSAPLILVPAMHPEMWSNSATVRNVQVLRSRGVLVIEPDDGRLTGADSGPGRYPESTRIVQELLARLESAQDLLGRRILISAGGTREAIDPVRYIGNRSSGIQGYALAQAAAARGAKVCLVSANVDLPPIPGIEIKKVESADEMAEVMVANASLNEVIIMCAAVADAKPVSPSLSKITKSELSSIELVRNPDILLELTKNRLPGQIFIGFAAETEQNLEDRGRAKMDRKGVDLLYVNRVAADKVFGSQQTEGLILSEHETVAFVGSKEELASQLLDRLLAKLS